MADEFEKACEDIKNEAVLKLMSDDEKLSMYSLFKQATVGDCNIGKPGMMDFKGKAKWNAWNDVKGTSTDQAKADYVALVRKFVK